MNTEKDGLSLESYIAIIKLVVGGQTRVTRNVWIMAFDLEDAKDSASTLCNKITRNFPAGCIDPKDYPYHPIWSVSAVVGMGDERVDLTNETSFEKLDPRWLEDQLGVRGANDHWMKAQEEVA